MWIYDSLDLIFKRNSLWVKTLDFEPQESILSYWKWFWCSRNRFFEIRILILSTLSRFWGSTVQNWTFESHFWAFGTQVLTSESWFWAFGTRFWTPGSQFLSNLASWIQYFRTWGYNLGLQKSTLSRFWWLYSSRLDLWESILGFRDSTLELWESILGIGDLILVL